MPYAFIYDVVVDVVVVVDVEVEVDVLENLTPSQLSPVHLYQVL